MAEQKSDAQSTIGNGLTGIKRSAAGQAAGVKVILAKPGEEYRAMQALYKAKK